MADNFYIEAHFHFYVWKSTKKGYTILKIEMDCTHFEMFVSSLKILKLSVGNCSIFTHLVDCRMWLLFLVKMIAYSCSYISYQEMQRKFLQDM